MAESDLSRFGLLCIDTQRAFTTLSPWGKERSNPAFEKNFEALLSAFRSQQTETDSGKKGPKIFHVWHSSTNPASLLHPTAANGENVKFMQYAEPKEGEPIVMKHENSGFIRTDLEAIIRAEKIEALYICGLVLDHCVSTTIRTARDLGVTDVDGRKGKVILVQDATATFNRGSLSAETIHEANCESLRGEFAEIMSTEEVLRLLDAKKG